MYAILDIETTGGQFDEEGITEIAIYKFNGHEVTDQFISLVNPEIPIQPFVVKLTGINNAMLRSAPKFYEIAKRIIEITQDCIIVAHNAQFDYRILRTEFKRLGYDFEKKTLCTVELSKKLLPEQQSYSLGKLVRSLGIPIANRHRATGDALATVQLFKLLLAKDFDKNILKNLVKTQVEKGLSPKLFSLLESIPSTTGIYYMYKENGDLIYIGRSKNIKKSINQHFTSNSSRWKRIQQEIFTLNYEETGNELIALLKESEELKRNKPIFNKGTKNSFPWSVYLEKDDSGFLSLALKRTDKRKKAILSFTTFPEGRNELKNITLNHFPEKNIFEETKNTFNVRSSNLNESPENHNNAITEFIRQNNAAYHNLILIDKGRSINEKSAVLIESGNYKGYAFFSLNHQINKPDILKNIITPAHDSSDAKNIILNYLRKNKVHKIIYF